MKNIWDEKAIRTELAKLDMQTGLKGAQLPIIFINTKRKLGYFSTAAGGSFGFSKLYFWNLDWVDEAAIDVIRHEYAHYMEHVLNNWCSDHGPDWKECCVWIGARPEQYYNDIWFDYIRKKHSNEEQLTEKLSVYHPGMKINHPTFGMGVIMEVEGNSPAKMAVISFDSVGCKKLGLEWVDSNCTIC